MFIIFFHIVIYNNGMMYKLIKVQFMYVQYIYLSVKFGFLDF